MPISQLYECLIITLASKGLSFQALSDRISIYTHIKISVNLCIFRCQITLFKGQIKTIKTVIDVNEGMQ